MLKDMDMLFAHKLFLYKDGSLYWKAKLNNLSRAKIGSETGYIGAGGYRYTKVNKKLYRTHQLIYLMFYGYIPAMIDHIDRNPLNNCIENLREVSGSQNQHNRGVQQNNTSGIKNVSWRKQVKKWQVQLMVGNKAMHFGNFNDLELAELVAIEARAKYHMEFASC